MMSVQEYSLPDGGTYTGTLNEAGEPHGEGTLTEHYPYLTIVYEGSWENGKRHGEGTLTENGCKTKGTWVHDKLHGKVEIRWEDGAFYEGEGREDGPHGAGTMTWENGARYTGQWDSGYRDGAGTMTWPDGSKYEGGWQEDKRHGKGVMTLANGLHYGAIWKDHGIEEFLSIDDGLDFRRIDRHDAQFNNIDGCNTQAFLKQAFPIGSFKISWSDGTCSKGHIDASGLSIDFTNRF
jgi:hypothetical protein